MDQGEKGEKNYLGLDWGEQNIGVALAHAETRVALSYAVLKNDKKLMKALGGIIKAENISMVVIGVPSYLNQDTGREARELGTRLIERLGVAVEYENEMFTTKMAEASLIARGEQEVSKDNDAEAARIILQGWLDKHEA